MLAREREALRLRLATLSMASGVPPPASAAKHRVEPADFLLRRPPHRPRRCWPPAPSSTMSAPPAMRARAWATAAAGPSRKRPPSENELGGDIDDADDQPGRVKRKCGPEQQWQGIASFRPAALDDRADRLGIGVDVELFDGEPRIWRDARVGETCVADPGGESLPHKSMLAWRRRFRGSPRRRSRN